MNFTLRIAAAGMLAAFAAAAVADGPPAAFAACAACHSEKAGALGPSLHNIVGRKAGSLPGFRYSAAMKESPIVWDEVALHAYIGNPQWVVPGNSMAYPGVTDNKQRTEIVDYLLALK